jgi:hypothetical protein
MTHDWQKTRQLLVAGTVPAIEAFFVVYPLVKERNTRIREMIAGRS